MNRPAFAFDTADTHVHEATRWTRFLLDRRLATSAPLTGSVDGVAHALPLVDLTDDGRAERSGLAGDFAQETFARLYANAPRTGDGGKHRWMPRVHDMLTDLPEFQHLAQSVNGDPDFAALATKSLMERVATHLPEMLEQIAEEPEQGDGEPGDGEPGDGGQGAGAGSGITAPTAQDFLGAALRRACVDTTEDVADARQGLGGLAPGLANSPLQRDQGDARRFALVERLRSDARLREVLRRAGRLQRIVAAKKRVRSADAREEVVSIERGGDLARILPSELMGLRHPTLRTLTLSKIIERKAMQYSLGGTEVQGRGPVVVLRDVSGSMEGEGHDWAAALCLMALGVAAKERRQITVVNFTHGIQDAWRLTASGQALTTDGNGGWSPMDNGVSDIVLAVASCRCWGGTDLTEPMRYALDECDLMEDRADLLLVTDGNAEAVRPEHAARIAEARERGLQVIALTVNGGSVSPSLAPLCDSITDLDSPGDTAKQAAKGIRL